MNRGTKLEGIIAQIIESEGPMRLDRYMALCLGDPAHGYYMAQEPFGTEGDFTTAPEISQMFGELIGAWCCHVWQEMGMPDPFRLVEMGPGRGTLMADMIRTIGQLAGKRACLTVDLVETSPRLRKLQADALAGVDVHWHATLDVVPKGPAIFVGNEFLDALPIRQFEYSKGAWFERVVGIDETGGLRLGLIPAALPADAHKPRSSPQDGALLEWSEAQATVAETIGRRLAEQGGAALLIDYGHAASAHGDTLQAVQGHRFAPVLHEPGRSDLTAHVDFEMITSRMAAAGALAAPTISQRELLLGLGLTQRADRLKSSANAARRDQIDSAVERLTDNGPTGMGRLFRALAVRHPGLPVPPPFQ